jgi:methyltransferase (TIGR00027 family)
VVTGQYADPVSATALWTAAVRARETTRADRLFDDPYADALAGPDGHALMHHMSPGGFVDSPVLPIRTRFFDDALRRLVGDGGYGQVVLLAAGMDSRAYRLNLPPRLRWIEVDQPDLLAVKADRLAALGAEPVCDRRTAGADLAGDWPATLRAAGLSREPTVWMAEGLLSYLDAAQVATFLGTISGLATPNCRLLIDIVGKSLLNAPRLAPMLHELAKYGTPWRFGTDDPAGLLAAQGWRAEIIRYGEEAASYGRWPYPPVDADDMRWPHAYLAVAQRT